MQTPIVRLSAVVEWASLAVLLAQTGCVTAAASAGQPTAVERQLLGAYEALDADLVRASSVRGPVAKAMPETYDRVRDLALEHRAVQRFNEDDVRELKAAQCVVETWNVTLAARACDARKRDAAVDRRLRRVVDEENRAREAILRWAAYEFARQSGRARPGPEVLAEVREAYRRLLVEAARPGDLVEVAPGRIEGKSP